MERRRLPGLRICLGIFSEGEIAVERRKGKGRGFRIELNVWNFGEWVGALLLLLNIM